MPLIDLEEGGGGIQSFTGTIVDAYFTENEYGLSLMVKSAFDDPENYVRFEDGCFTRYFPCGPKWQTTDGGATASHPDGDTKRFNTSTKIGQFLAALNAVPGIEDVVDPTFSAYTADSYKGLHLTWGQVPVQRRRMKKDETGADTGTWESYEASELLPVAIAGQAAPTADEVPSVDITTLGLSPEQNDAVLKLAATATTDAAFIEGVTKIDGLVTLPAFMQAMAKDTAGLRAAFAAEPF